MNENAVSNSSCLIALEKIEYLNLLIKVFHTINIPPSVQNEIGWSIDWLHVTPVNNQGVVQSLNTQIDLGESEAIALAMELEDVVLLLDDKKARRIAKHLGLKVVGTIGLLLHAKKKGIIAEVKPIMDALQQVNFRISEKLYRKALHLADEA